MKVTPIEGNPFKTEDDLSIGYKTTVIEGNPFETEDDLSVGYKTTVVEGNPFEDAEVSQPEFGPLKENYKGIDAEVEAVLSKKDEGVIEEEKPSRTYSGKFFGDLETPPEKRAENREGLKALGTDVLKVAYSIPRGVVDLMASGVMEKLTGLDMSKLEPKEREELVNKLTDMAIDMTAPAFSAVDWNKRVINPETGQIAPVETVAGMGLQLGAFVFATGKVAKVAEIGYKGIKLIPSVVPQSANWARTTVVTKEKSGEYIATKLIGKDNLAKGLAMLTGVEVATQVMIDPDNNLFNFVEDSISEDTEGGVGLIRDMGEFFSADKDDTELTKRLKLSFESLSITAVFKIVTNPKAVGRFMVGKHPSQMSKEEQIEAVMKQLDYERQILNMLDPQKLKLVEETPEGLAQVARQRDSFLSRMNQKFLTTEGYSTPLMYHAQQNAKFTQKQLVQDAQIVATHLDRALNSAGNNKDLISKTTRLLETDLTDIINMKPNKQVSALAKKYDVPEDVASEILSFRKLQDGLTTRVINMKGFSDESKATLIANLGKYIRSTYRAFEDSGYKPTSKVMKDAEEYYVAKIQAKALKRGKTVSNAKALKQAKIQIEKKLGNSDEVVDYVNQINKVAKLRKKKELDPEVRALLGEITDPSEKIVLSLAKLSRIAEMQQYYNVVDQLSKGKNGYIQSAENVNRGLTVQIKGTNSILDNKWTTPEIEKAVLNKQNTFDTLSAKSASGTAWRFYVGAQGVAQSMQTVFNHVTQARNAVGSASFLVANGHNPLSMGGLKALGTLENEILGARAGLGRVTGLYKVDEKKSASYLAELQGYGVIDSSVKLNQFRDMLSDGFQGSDSVSRTIGAGKSKAVKFATKLAKKPQDVYGAVDDFSKIIAFESELKTLRKAFPNETDELLKRRSANLVQKTIPTYQNISPGFQQARNIPLGNYISFPVEVVRTSINIVKQAAKEIASDNRVIKMRGLRRAAGFATANMGYGYLAKSSYDHYNMDDQEVEDRRVLKSSKFSSAHDLIYSMDDEGNYFTTNTEFLNSYYYMKEPFVAAYDRIISGQLKGEELDAYMLGAAGTYIKTLTDPFTAESMVLSPWIDMATAALSKDNEDRQGRQLFPDKDSNVDHLRTVLTEGFKPLIPGSVTNLIKLKDALNEKSNKWSGRFRDPEYAKLEQFGIKKEPYLADEYLKWAIEDYKLQNDQNRTDSVNLESTDEEMTRDFYRTNAVEFQYQQDLWIKASAYARIKTPEEAFELLIKNKISPAKAGSILEGRFVPLAPRYDPTAYRLEALARQTPEFIEGFSRGINKAEFEQWKAYEEMDLLTLGNLKNYNFSAPEGSIKVDTDTSFLESNPPLTPEEREELGLMPKATGGEVSTPVPNAPIEPDERINKLTGLPYNEGAGTAYMDADDPMRVLNMAAGGRVKKDLGGLLSKASSFIGDTIRDAVPTNIRQLAYDVTGGTADLTENNLQEDEKKALIDAVNLAKKEGRTAIEYSDYATHKKGQSQYRDVGGGGGPQAFISKLSDPAYSMKTTLGQASFKEDAEGNTIITDQYNFNDSTGESSLLRFIGGVKNAGPSLYGQARNVAREFGSQEGEGSEVTINLGNLSFLNTDNKGPV